MKATSETPEAVDVDFNSPVFDKEFKDEDLDTPTLVKTASMPAQAARPKPEDNDLLDLSDDATLDKLSSGGFMRIRPEGQNVVSVAFFKPAVLAKTHFSTERNKTFGCLQPASDFCCKHLGEARDVIGVLAIQYGGASPKDGSLKKGADPDLRVGYVTLSKSALITMRKALPDDEGASLYSADWKIWKKTSGIGYDYAVHRTTPAYKTLGLEKQIEELIAPFTDGVKLRKRVARPMSVAEVKFLVTGESPEAEDGKLDDMESL